MDILTFVKTKLSDCNAEKLREVSNETRIPIPTLIRIKYNETENPRIKTIQPLFNYFKK